MELTFTPAEIRHRGINGYYEKISSLPHYAHAAIEYGGYELDADAEGRILVGVPAGHDTVFTVGPYTITLDR